MQEVEQDRQEGMVSAVCAGGRPGPSGGTGISCVCMSRPGPSGGTGISCVRVWSHDSPAVVMVSIKWPRVGSTTLAM